MPGRKFTFLLCALYGCSILTCAAVLSSSTTTLSGNVTTAYTSSPNNSVTVTATVIGSAGTPTGTVTFKDGNNNLTCSQGGNPRPLIGGQATCSISFSAEGIHALSATYSGDSNHSGSSGSANLFAQNHATNSGFTYCNNGAVSNNGMSGSTYSSTSPYPSVIFLGDGVNTDLTTAISTVSVQLKGLTTNNATAMQFLLVAPDGTHAYEFLSSGVGNGATSGNYTFLDGASPVTCNSLLAAGIYAPIACVNTDVFTPAPPNPAPQPPATFLRASPAGGQNETFGQAFSGVSPHGAWKLFFYDNGGSGNGASLSTGWCISIILPTTGKILANAGGGFRIDFTGNPNQQYTVQYAPSLSASPATDWQTLTMQTAAANGTFFVTDTPPAGTTMRFYRAIVP